MPRPRSGSRRGHGGGWTSTIGPRDRPDARNDPLLRIARRVSPGGDAPRDTALPRRMLRRLSRQAAPGDWDEVFERMTDELTEFAPESCY